MQLSKDNNKKIRIKVEGRNLGNGMLLCEKLISVDKVDGQTQQIQKKFKNLQVFEKLLLRFHSGDCLITLATGKLSKDDCDRAGLVDSHAYALLDLRKIDVSCDIFNIF